MTGGKHRDRETMGRCVPCNVTYRWPGPPMRRDALCPRCHAPLKTALLHAPGKLVLGPPATKPAQPDTETRDG
jgi:hypothetical protein